VRSAPQQTLGSVVFGYPGQQTWGVVETARWDYSKKHCVPVEVWIYGA
jgi:hypothetical protein